MYFCPGQTRISWSYHLLRGGLCWSHQEWRYAKWPQPTTIKGLRGFPGLTGYYWRYVKHYGVFVKPLMELLKKDKLHWSEEVTATFHSLKHTMTSVSTLELHNFSLPLIVETYASNIGVGVVIIQGKQLIAFLGKDLLPSKRGLSTYEKVLWALISAINKWRYYLYGRPFVIRTDHHNLKFLLEQGLSTLIQRNWLSKMLAYNYTI